MFCGYVLSDDGQSARANSPAVCSVPCSFRGALEPVRLAVFFYRHAPWPCTTREKGAANPEGGVHPSHHPERLLGSLRLLAALFFVDPPLPTPVDLLSLR